MKIEDTHSIRLGSNRRPEHKFTSYPQTSTSRALFCCYMVLYQLKKLYKTWQDSERKIGRNLERGAQGLFEIKISCT